LVRKFIQEVTMINKLKSFLGYFVAAGVLGAINELAGVRSSICRGA